MLGRKIDGWEATACRLYQNMLHFKHLHISNNGRRQVYRWMDTRGRKKNGVTDRNIKSKASVAVWMSNVKGWDVSNEARRVLDVILKDQVYRKDILCQLWYGQKAFVCRDDLSITMCERENLSRRPQVVGIIWRF